MKDQLKSLAFAGRPLSHIRPSGIIDGASPSGGLIDLDRAVTEALAGVNDQFFLGEELERAIAFHVDGIAKFLME